MAHDLESTLKEKVAPLLEGMMEKSWGITIPQLGTDITDKLKNPFLQMYIPPDMTFAAAKKTFKAAFLKKELGRHLGNVSELARLLGIDRRSIHRAIKDLAIDVVHLRRHYENPQELAVDKTIRAALEEYRGLIQPQQLEKMYAEVPQVSKNIAQFLPHQELSWKEAEREFERQLLSRAVQSQEGNISVTAKKLQIRVETLYRKLKKLGIR